MSCPAVLAGAGRPLARFLLSVLLFAATLAHAQVAASIVFATGTVSILAADGSARRAERGGEVSAGETVDTADGRIQLRFRDGATMSLQPGTQFRVDQFRFADQGGKASPEDRGFFSLIKGGFRTISGLIGKGRSEQYRVDTAVGTIGIRGTEYSALFGPPGLAVSTFAGLVEVCNDAGCAQVGPGQSTLVPDRNVRPVLQGGTVPLIAPAVPATPPPVVAPELTPPPQQRHIQTAP